MRLLNPKSKSLVAGSILLIPMIKRIFSPVQSHGALHIFDLILCSTGSAYCFWHAFKGRRALLGKSEKDTSLFLGALSLIGAVVLTFARFRYPYHPPELLIAFAFYAAATFFFSQASRERSSSAS